MNNTSKRIYNTQKRIAKRRMTIFFVIMGSILISVGLIGRQTVLLEKQLEERFISPAKAEKAEPKRKLTIQEDVWEILDGYGLTLEEKVKAVSIISCESGWNPFAIGVNKGGDKDLGLWQTSERFQKISRGCAFDYVCQTKYIMENIYLKQKNWSAWTCNKHI